jgi:hypothetical protein
MAQATGHRRKELLLTQPRPTNTIFSFSRFTRESQGVFAKCHLASGSFVLEYYGQLDVDVRDWDKWEAISAQAISAQSGAVSRSGVFFTLAMFFCANHTLLLRCVQAMRRESFAIAEAA